VPQLKDIADISGEQVANIGSQTMNHEVWLKLAKRINEVLKGDTDGVVITHGTDTMEETAYFLGLVVKSDKPVVLVGSMRPATAIGADGPANLYNAVALAANPEAKGRGPLVVLNDEIHDAHEVQKTNSTQLDTFKSPNRGRAGVMNTGKAYFFSQSTTRHTKKSEFSVDGKGVNDLPYVEVVYSYANFGRDMIDFLVGKGVKGIVLAGVGDGNSTDTAIAALADAAKKGIAVVRATRTGSGLIVRNVEVDDDKLGFIASMELNPQKARILLMLGLMKTKDPKKLQEFFMVY
jgi:L-asparaginase